MIPNFEELKTIAEFMGGKMILDDHHGISLIQLPGNREYDLCQLQYHKSWDWLMPVVETINIVDDYRFTVTIQSMDVEIFDNLNVKEVWESGATWQPDELLESVYEAVVEFIKYYNNLTTS